MTELPHYELTVGEVDDDENVYITSLVSNPATQRNYHVFSQTDDDESEETETEQVVVLQFMPDTKDYQRIISGVWMMPDTKYFRIHKGYEFTVSFTQEALKQALVNNLKNGYADKFDTEHDHKLVSNLVSIEHWIIEDENTVSPIMGYTLSDLGYTFQDIPKGTVMKSVYFKDEELFKDTVLNGNLKGYSIDGLFNIKEINTMAEQFKASQLYHSSMFSELNTVQSNGTVITTEGNLQFNNNVITLNDSAVKDGEFKTNLGFNIIIRNGVLVDFGFNDVTPSVVDSTVAVQEESKVTATNTDEAIAVANDVNVNNNVSVVDNAIDNTVTKPIIIDNVNDALAQKVEALDKLLHSEIAKKDARIAELEAKINEEVKVKEELIKAKPLTVKEPVAKNNDVIYRTKGGVTYEIPKR